MPFVATMSAAWGSTEGAAEGYEHLVTPRDRPLVGVRCCDFRIYLRQYVGFEILNRATLDKFRWQGVEAIGNTCSHLIVECGDLRRKDLLQCSVACRYGIEFGGNCHQVGIYVLQFVIVTPGVKRSVIEGIV
jgi:hypothetical protein